MTLCARLTLAEPWATTIGCTLALLTGLYTLRSLIRIIGIDQIDRYIRKILLSFKLRTTGWPGDPRI
jgi:hypothetical protein